LDLSPVIELNGIATLLLLAFCFLLSISFVSRWATICWSFFLIFHNAVGCFSVGLSPALNHIYKDNEPRSLGLGWLDGGVVEGMVATTGVCGSLKGWVRGHDLTGLVANYLICNH